MKPTSTPWTSDSPLELDQEALGSVLDSLGKGDMDLFSNLNIEERQFVLQLVESLDKGDSAVLESLYSVDYESIPVEPDVFFTETDYMGHIGRDIYKAWWGHLLKCTDPVNGIYEIMLTGPIGIGKTLIGMLIMAYKIYRLSKLREPARFFGLAAKSQIIFGVYSLTLAHAEDVGFYKLRDQFIDESPYFKEVFPRRPYGTDTIEWPQKSLKVITGSGSLHAIGKDLFAIVIDEVNFMAKGKATAAKAHELANAVSRRLESRFMSGMGIRDVPGVCIFISSKKAETDYLEQRISKLHGLPGIHIVDGPQWEFLAGDKIDYCGTKFRVLLGDATHDPLILDDVSFKADGRVSVVPSLSQYEEARLEGKIIDVPIEHYKAFAEDILGAIRDVAGIASSATVNFFPRKKVVQEMFNSGKALPKYFRSETIVMPIRSPVKLTTLFDLDLACAVNLSKRLPYRHPNSPRYIHVDLARNKDAVGLVMVHPSEFVIQSGDEVQGTKEVTVEKSFEVDFVIRLITDDTGEDVDFNKIVEFIIWLKRNGFWIQRVTYDSYQSAGSIQALRTFGIDAGVRSVDGSILPYRILSRVVHDRKISCPKHDILQREMGELLYKSDKDKVDHPEVSADGTAGSKDCSDALAGSVYECMIDKRTPSDISPITKASHVVKYDDYLSDLAKIQSNL